MYSIIERTYYSEKIKLPQNNKAIAEILCYKKNDTINDAIIEIL